MKETKPTTGAKRPAADPSIDQVKGENKPPADASELKIPVMNSTPPDVLIEN